MTRYTVYFRIRWYNSRTVHTNVHRALIRLVRVGLPIFYTASSIFDVVEKVRVEVSGRLILLYLDSLAGC